MANFVLVPGAGGSAWYWHRLVAEPASVSAWRSKRCPAAIYWLSASPLPWRTVSPAAHSNKTHALNACEVRVPVATFCGLRRSNVRASADPGVAGFDAVRRWCRLRPRCHGRARRDAERRKRIADRIRRLGRVERLRRRRDRLAVVCVSCWSSGHVADRPTVGAVRCGHRAGCARAAHARLLAMRH